MNNPNYDADKLERYRDEIEQDKQERYEKQQARKQSLNDARHVLDPDREWGETE